MNLVGLRRLHTMGRLPVGLFLVVMLMSIMVIADGPITSSSFVGVEDPLSENGAWAALTSLSPNGSRFQKNNGAYPDLPGNGANHAGARTTAVVPADHYSEIVVGHVGNNINNHNNVGPIVRVQASGPSVDSHYLWWASVAANGVNNLYRIDANGTTYTANAIVPSSPVVDGDRLRLIARGPVIYGIKNGVRDFIYNTGPDATKYSTGTTGMLAYAGDGGVTNAMIASWSTGAAPVSSGTWASSTFAGTENPLDEGDRWYPLPGYSGFKKVGGLATGRDSGHNASGVWSITPPANQYSEVTLGTVTSGGGGPIVRINRSNAGQTGWLLFLYAGSPSSSGIYKMNPDASFTAEQLFTPTIVPGDKWRLTANGNTLEVLQNGVSQFKYTTDGSYPTGDVGIEALSSNFTFTGWQGGDTASGTAPAPTITSFTPTSGQVGTSVTLSGTNFTGATAVTFNGVSASFTVTSATAIQATAPAGATTGPLSVTTPGGTATSTNNFTVVSAPPTITSFTPTSGQVGTSVTLSGTNFTGATAVTFNGVSASFTVTSATAIQATAPAAATTGPLSVTTPGGTATSTNNFTVVVSAPPTITSFTPTSGSVGTSVTLSGTNFTGATAVTFNGVSASFTVTSATAIQATAPAAATTGPLSVTTPGGTATSTNNFTVVGAPPTISSNFVGAEDPLSENGAWATLTAFSPHAPYNTQFQKNNGAYPDQLVWGNHAGARTTAVVPTDHYSEIVVGHVGNSSNNVGPIVRVQVSGASDESHYLWWASVINGANYLYRMDAHVPDPYRQIGYTAKIIMPTSPVVDGDRLRFIARGPVIYGIKNGVRDFIYNTGTDTTKYTTGTTGIFAYPVDAVTNAMIASWSTGAAPVSSGTWASSTFAGTENPLDEGDRWYPLPGYSGFKKVGGFAIGRDSVHNASGAWSITPPATQYSEVTLGTVASGGGGPIVRIDRSNAGQTGWLLFLWADNPSSSGIYKMNPDATFTAEQLFTPIIVPGDKWRLTANGNTLEVLQNGVSQFKYTTDGSYPTGDVGIEALSSNFTFTRWEGGDTAGGTAPAPTISSFTPTSGPVGTSVTLSGTNFTGATAVTFNGVSASFTVTSATAIQATAPAGATTGPLSVTTPGGTATSTKNFTIIPAPTISSFTPTSGPIGTSVTISGTNFTGATAVTFNGASATFTVTSATAIQATAPAAATTGPLSVTTPGGTATSTSNFKVTTILTVTKAGNGSGTVTSSSSPVSPTQINCGPTCSVTYDSGTVVTLTATPATGSTYTAWNGCDSVSGATCTVTMNAARSVNATFTLQRFPLTVNKTNVLIGNGTVTSSSSPNSPNQINCGSTCSASYDYGTVVTLTATPDFLSGFNGWSGCDAASGNTCTVSIGAARTVTANFVP